MNNDPTTSSSPQTPETKFCPRCGSRLPADAIFCGECGFRMDGSSPAESEPLTVPPQQAQPADTAPLKTSEYVVLHLLNMIPVVGLILMLVWSFSDNVNLNRKNFCRAYLIIYAISLVLSIFLIILYAVIFAMLFQNTSVSADPYEAFGMIFR